jgi:hypothetical protein
LRSSTFSSLELEDDYGYDDNEVKGGIQLQGQAREVGWKEGTQREGKKIAWSCKNEREI